MQKLFTKEYIAANCGCYSQEKLKVVYKENNKLCLEEKECNITLDELLDSNIPLKDKFWFICHKVATKLENQQIAIGVAGIVLEIYENKYPDNKTPREAIQSAQAYLNKTGITEQELIEKRRDAANAAYAANAAAYAAYDADDAANAAAYAANAATYAANAAANAAYAADAATYAANAATNAAYDAAYNADAANAAYAADAAATAYDAAYAAYGADAAYNADASTETKNYKSLLLVFLKDFCKSI